MYTVVYKYKFYRDNVQFNHPSSKWIRDKCDALGIEYSMDAYQIWGKCNIDLVTLVSLPEEVDSEPSTVYESISMLLTGTKSSAAKIEKALIKNFSSKYKLLGK